jgi:dihydrofolate synthase/folylpolyglutamate synthase
VAQRRSPTSNSEPLGALSVFAEARVEAAILEVGLGGRLDAVNIVDADCAIVASVDIDHVAYLGDTREAIGFEKAGIFRAARPAICGDPDPPSTLVEHAGKIGADLQVLGREFGFQRQDRQWDFLGKRGAKRALPIPRSAARGSCVTPLARWRRSMSSPTGCRSPSARSSAGSRSSRCPAGCRCSPGARRSCSTSRTTRKPARALADGLGDMGFYENTYAVFAMLADKDIGAVIDAIAPRIDRWFVASPPSDRACFRRAGGPTPRGARARGSDASLRHRRICPRCGASRGGCE